MDPSSSSILPPRRNLRLVRCTQNTLSADAIMSSSMARRASRHRTARHRRSTGEPNHLHRGLRFRLVLAQHDRAKRRISDMPLQFGACGKAEPLVPLVQPLRQQGAAQHQALQLGFTKPPLLKGGVSCLANSWMRCHPSSCAATVTESSTSPAWFFSVISAVVLCAFHRTTLTGARELVSCLRFAQKRTPEIYENNKNTNKTCFWKLGEKLENGGSKKACLSLL